MFTGLIQATGTVKENSPFGTGRRLAVDVSGLSASPAIGASIAVSGACLTVTSLNGTVATFDAVRETVQKSKLAGLRAGDLVNLEPALRVGDPLDGHIVTGHVDAVGSILSMRDAGGSWAVRIELPEAICPLVATKGSIAVDGISLTVAEATREWFSVAVIPHTYRETILHSMTPGARVNLEADILARYAARRADLAEGGGGLSEAFLRENGF